MYRTRKNDIEIQEREITKVTKHFVFYNTRGKEEREALESEWHNWHDSKERAKEWMVNYRLKKISLANAMIDNANEEIIKIQLM